MSGRHLQQGDGNQLQRPQEVFTNCSTAATSFTLFYLLLNGSGVGRCYDDDVCLVNWDNMPTLRVVLDDSHPDFNHSQHTSVRDAKHLYGKGANVHWFDVPDSREGWAEAVELLEVMAYQRVYRDDMLIIDFSNVRGKGEPIMGMQGGIAPRVLHGSFEAEHRDQRSVSNRIGRSDLMPPAVAIDLLFRLAHGNPRITHSGRGAAQGQGAWDLSI